MPVTTLHGSSPHTRGAPATSGAKTACASDHPRIRGEHGEGPVDGVQDPGSSPHTRGARPRRPGTAPRRRIIPAYAGSTTPPTRSRSRPADHPRIRGEHGRGGGVLPPELGSSPHTRGARRTGPRQRRLSGIIPAYAGSTTDWTAAAATIWDHPRIRGEHDPKVCLS